MRAVLPAILLAIAAPSVAFPAIAAERFADAQAAGCPFAANAAKLKRDSASASVTFDPVHQKVDTTGQYAFVPPKAGDQRVSNTSTTAPAASAKHYYFRAPVLASTYVPAMPVSSHSKTGFCRRWRTTVTCRTMES